MLESVDWLFSAPVWNGMAQNWRKQQKKASQKENTLRAQGLAPGELRWGTMKFSMPDVGIKYPVDYTEEKGIAKILAKSRNYSKVIECFTSQETVWQMPMHSCPHKGCKAFKLTFQRCSSRAAVSRLQTYKSSSTAQGFPEVYQLKLHGPSVLRDGAIAECCSPSSASWVKGRTSWLITTLSVPHRGMQHVHCHLVQPKIKRTVASRNSWCGFVLRAQRSYTEGPKQVLLFQ